MSRTDDELLYGLLPAFVRNRDVVSGEPLRALMLVLERQYRTLHGNIGDLHRNAFIETCEEWVVPYLGELLGIDPELSEIFHRPRQWVANALALRRGKGVPEVLCRAVEMATGWRARVIAPGTGIATSPDLDHSPTSFGPAVRTARIEAAECAPGGPGPGEVGVEIRRLASFTVERAWARRQGEGRYTVHPLGIDCPLFRSPRTVGAEAGSPGDPATEDPGFVIYVGGRAVPPGAVERADLSDWRPPEPKPGRHGGKGDRPDKSGQEEVRVAVDPVRGRLTVGSAAGASKNRSVEVTWTYGACAEIGGGPYGRGGTLEPAGVLPWRAVVGRRLRPADPESQPDSGGRGSYRFQRLSKALEAWKASGESGVIRILDSGNYAVARPGPFTAELAGERRLVIEAADGCRPCVVGAMRFSAGDASGGSVRLAGLLVDGTVRAEGGLLVKLDHTTLRPPGPGEKPATRLALAGTDAGAMDASSGTGEPPLRLRLTRSICGPIGLASGAADVVIEDSILDGGSGRALAGAGGSRLTATIARSTVFGSVTVHAMPRADEVLFTAPVKVAVRRSGVVSHSFVPTDSLTPPRERCQPDLASSRDLEAFGPAEAETVGRRLRPSFTSRRYGDPGYAQLDRRCPAEIRHGGEAGAEMGAYHLLDEPRREAALTAVLEEYVPWGLKPRVVFAD